MAIVLARYTLCRFRQNESSQNNISQKVSRRILSYSRDKNTGQERETWTGPLGPTSEQKVQRWAQAQMRRYRYMYTLILGANPKIPLHESHFLDIIESDPVFNNWRFIIHTDTATHHAHVIAFMNQLLDRRRFVSWRKDVSLEITAYEEDSLLFLLG